MSVHFGLSTSNRQASLDFAAKGLNIRKVNEFAAMEMRVISPQLPFQISTFYTTIPYVMASAHLQHPLVIGKPLFGFSMNQLSNYKDGSSVISFATPAPLNDTLIRKHSLIFKNPGGKYSSGYYTQHPIEFSDLADFAVDFPNTLVHRSSGVTGIGLSLKAASGLITLGRLVSWFLVTQLPVDYLPSRPSIDGGRGFIETTLAESMDENAKVEVVSIEEEEILSIGSVTATTFDINTTDLYGVIRQTTLNQDAFWVHPDNLPPHDGHVFEFVESSLPADKRMVRDILVSHFSTLFSTDGDRAFSAISVIVDNLVPISRHEHGQELLHILMTMSLGIRCAGQTVVVVDERHKLLGTVLLTTSNLYIESRVLDPLSVDELSEAVGKWMTSKGARQMIADRLTHLVCLESKKKELVTLQRIDSHASLTSEIMKRTRFPSITNSLLSAIRLSDYSHRWLPATSENIAICLRNIAERKIPESFMVTEVLFTDRDTPAVANLSLFGPKSISFLNAGGKAIDLYRSRDDDPLVGKKKKVVVQEVRNGRKGKKIVESKESEVFSWNRICVSRVSIAEAVRDLQSIKDNHRIMQVQSFDTKILGNVDVHGMSGGNGEILEALRYFGGDDGDFIARKKKVDFVGPMDRDDGIDERDQVDDLGF